jgi:nucleotide-binding universal stress UspA family protein
MPPVLFAEESRVNAHLTEPETEDIAAHVRAWLAPAAGSGLTTEVIVEEGQPASQIVARAASLPADLVVLGTHGRSGFDRVLLGSVTEKVLRKLDCPVMTVPPPAAHPSQLPYKQLLCPVDFSPPSLAALRFAMSMAKESDARLTIAYVIEWTATGLAPNLPFDYSEFRKEFEVDSQRRLEALVSEEERTWCQPTTRLLTGKPYQEILTLARNEDVDLIVMGVHGQSVLDRMLFGSTTNHVVRQANCPVLTLKG